MKHFDSANASLQLSVQADRQMVVNHMHKHIYNWLIKFLELQLFVTIGSLPIFIWWGLPISIMTIVGNLIFSPILILFLFLSALIFFTQLVYIPNGLLIYGLNLLTNLCVKILSFGDKSWMIGLKDKYMLFSLIPFVLAFIIVKSQLKREYKVLFLGLTLISSTTFLHAFPNNNLVTKEVTKGRSSAVINIKDQKTIVAENGTFSKKSSKSFIKYKLLPEIIKLTGKNTIDKLIIKHLTKTGLESLKYANGIIIIKEIEVLKGDVHLIQLLKESLYETCTIICNNNNIS